MSCSCACRPLLHTPEAFLEMSLDSGMPLANGNCNWSDLNVITPAAVLSLHTGSVSRNNALDSAVCHGAIG
jgi:hypothetical protein